MAFPEKDYPTNVFGQVIVLLEDLSNELKEQLEYILDDIKGE